MIARVRIFLTRYTRVENTKEPGSSPLAAFFLHLTSFITDEKEKKIKKLNETG